MTDGLLQAQLLVLAGVLPRAKLKGVLQRNIGKFEEDCCVFFKFDPHLLPVAVAGVLQPTCTWFAGQSIKVYVEFSMTA